MNDDEFLCVRCARRRKTCCQVSEIYVTHGDARRVSEYTGRSDFYEYRAPDNPSYAEQDDDPEWQRNVFRADGSRRVLKRRPDGDCTFLGTQGCTLPLAVRPLICRLYPYDYTAEGILPELSPGCPVELLRPGQSLIDALDMRLADALHWHRQLYDEIREEQHAETLPVATRSLESDGCTGFSPCASA